MLFDTTHILYIVISLVVTAAIVAWCVLCKERRHKDIFVKFFGIATVLLHISIMWVEFLRDGSSSAKDNILFPIYFCNMSMWLLLFVSLVGNKESKVFQCFAQIAAYAGIFGALISLFYPDYYVGNPNLADWAVLKSMLSHSTMLAGGLCLLLGGYFKIGVKNMIPFTAGMVGFMLIGFILNALFPAFGLTSPNSMFLEKSAIDEVPLFTGYFIGMLILLITFIFTVIYEQIAYDKQDRWYSQLIRLMKREKTGQIS